MSILSKHFSGLHLNRKEVEGELSGSAHAAPANEYALRTDTNHSSGRNVMQARAIAAVVAVAGALIASDPACAQSVAAVEQVMVGVSAQSKQLDAALANLGAIAKTLHGTDADGADEVANAGRQFSGAVGEATPVGVILRHMKSSEDIRFTRAMLAISATKALLAADSDIEIINRALPRIETPAASAESAKVRDAIVMSRNLLETFALTANAPARPQAPTYLSRSN
jgi:hypothetical protein